MPMVGRYGSGEIANEKAELLFLIPEAQKKKRG